VGFINHELRRVDAVHAPIDTVCGIVDTLQMARRLHPGQKNSLDALCKRYGIDNSQRTLHGALLDAEILADVYLSMTGGQVTLELESAETAGGIVQAIVRKTRDRVLGLPVVRATAEELAAHKAFLEKIRAASGGDCLWDQVEEKI
jgi:DNA polymerase-3 subunit epsilon